MEKSVQDVIADTAAMWSSVAAPNAAAVEMAAGLAGVIAGFTALRGALAFEEEPSSFLAALMAAKEASS